MYNSANVEQVRALLLEHDKVWFDDKTPLRTLMYHHSMLINRLNNADGQNIPDAVKKHMR